MSDLNFAPPLVEREDLTDGAFILRSPVALAAYPATMCAHLERWAKEQPDKTFLAERANDGSWRELSYGAARQQARAIAQSLLNRGISSDRPIMIISDNSIDHGLLVLGAYYAGIPTSAISPPYALASTDYGKLKHVFGVLKPSMIYVSDGTKFENALAALELNDGELVVSSNPAEGRDTTLFETLLGTDATGAVDDKLATLTSDTIAKILFTSGSTGMPKGVINNHKMLCSNQQALAQVWPFVEERPPVLVDWLPWSHTFGSNHNFNLVLRNGGMMYIDTGKPVPGLFDASVANLKEIAPTIYFNVPAGYAQLVPILEADDAFRDHFFSRLDTLFYAAAALPQNLWDRLEKLSLAALGHKIAMTSAWGSTETAPLASGVHFRIDRAGVMGLPVPGTELKMVPNVGKLEIRVRGPNVTPGYFRRPDVTEESFDADGFYCIGDAVKLADPDDPSRGIIFDGRVAEDFKLLTGSWVSVSNIRVAAISASGSLIQDAVVTGHDRDEIGLLVFPNFAELARVAALPVESAPETLCNSPAVQEALNAALAEYNCDHLASSMRIARALFQIDPPDQDKNEITDKGYINQRAVIGNRGNEIEKLYQGAAGVVLVSKKNC